MLNIKIAYDLDGVICPDLFVDYEITEDKIEELHKIRDKICPIFHPTGAYIVITGRPLIDKPYTEKWLKKHDLYPQEVYHNEGDMNNATVIKHKADTLNKFKYKGIQLYVESDPKQVQLIRQHTDIMVIHFAEFISRGLLEWTTMTA